MPFRPSSLCIAALIIAALAGRSSASAQDRETARADFRAGVTSLESGDYAAAEAAFSRSLAGHPTAAAQCNLALTYDRWGGHGPQALAAYEACTERDASGQYRDHAIQRAAELRAERDAALAASSMPPSSTGPSPIAVTQSSSVPTMAPTNNTSPRPTMVYRQAPPEDPSRAFLWLGLASTVLAGGALVAGLLLASSAGADVEELESAGYRMDGDRYLIPANDPGVDTLSAAETKSAAAIGLYIGAAVTGALAITFYAIQGTSSSDDDAELSLTPIEGGAMATARLTLD